MTAARLRKGQHVGRLVVEYMEEQLQGEGTGGEAARVQKWNLQISVHWMMYVLNRHQ